MSFFMSKYIATDRAPLAVGAILICSSVSAYDSGRAIAMEAVTWRSPHAF